MTDTAQIIPMKPQSINALIAQAKAAWDRADEKKSDADKWYIKAGELLVELKARVKKEGGRWLPTLKKIGRSERRARELMRLAAGDETIEQQRDRARKAMKKSRAKKKTAQRYAENRDQDATTFAADQEDTLEERWSYAACNFFGDIISRQAYWDREFPGWKQFDRPSQVATLMKEAATAFASLVKIVAAKG